MPLKNEDVAFNDTVIETALLHYSMHFVFTNILYDVGRCQFCEDIELVS